MYARCYDAFKSIESSFDDAMFSAVAQLGGLI